MPELRPIVACLGDSAGVDFRLVLALGREYNGSGGLSRYVGRYSFSESPRSTFWNRTYAFISRTCPGAHHLKTRCVATGLSPVVFANVMPQPIPSASLEQHKRRIRAGISEREVREHVRAIFGVPIAPRLGLVLLSVGDSPEFASAVNQVEAECVGRGLPLLELPYLGSRVSDRSMDAALYPEQADPLCSVVSEFLAAQDERPRP